MLSIAPLVLSVRIQRICEFSFLAAVFVLPFAKAGFEILFGLALFFWILGKIVGRASFRLDLAILIVLGIFILSSLVSAFGSGYPEISFRGMIKLLKYVFVMLVAADLFTDDNSAKRLLVIGLLGFSLVLLDSLAQNIWGRELIFNYPIRYATEQIRLTGPYQSYGLLAAHTIVFIPILVAFIARSGSNLKKIGWGALLLTACYILYRTQSRGAWLAALGSLVAYGLLSRHKWFLVVLVVVTLAAPFTLPKQILFHRDILNQEQSLVERKLLWNRAISVIKARPWFGCGIGTYTKNYPKYTQGEKWSLIGERAIQSGYTHEKESWRIPGHPNQIPGYYVHNGYLQLAAETGLVSLGFFLIVLGMSFCSGFQALKRVEKNRKPLITGLICGLVALLLQAFVDTTLNGLQSAVFVWLGLGLLIAVKNIKANEQNA